MRIRRYSERLPRHSVRHPPLLAGEPIEAKRDSVQYVFKKTLRRYKGVAVAFILLVALSSVVSWTLYQPARRARNAEAAAGARACHVNEEAC